MTAVDQKTNESARPEQARALALWAEHPDVHYVARQTGLSDLDVRVLLRDAGVELPRRARGERVSIDVERVVQLYREGQAPSTIAQALNVSRGAIYHALEIAGVPLRQPARAMTPEPREVKPEPSREVKPEPRVERVIELARLGIGTRRIAAEVRMGLATIRKVLQDAHVPRRPPGGVRSKPVRIAQDKATRLELIRELAVARERRRKQSLVARAHAAERARAKLKELGADGGSGDGWDHAPIGADEVDPMLAREAVRGGLAPDLALLDE